MMLPSSTELLARTFAALQKPLLGFEIAVKSSAAQIDCLQDIRIDGPLTQFFVDERRKQLLWDMALASTAVTQIKSLLSLKKEDVLL